MTKCKNYKRYKGIRKPTCRKGNPCESCLYTYHTMMYQKALMKQMFLDIRNDDGKIVKTVVND